MGVPNFSISLADSLDLDVATAITSQTAPVSKGDGGNVEVIDYTDDHIVLVKWLGTCQSCNMSAMTMKAGIEEAIKRDLPEIASVEAVNLTPLDVSNP